MDASSREGYAAGPRPDVFIAAADLPPPVPPLSPVPSPTRGLMTFLIRPAAVVAALVTECRRSYAAEASRRGRRQVTVSGGGAVEYLGRFRAADVSRAAANASTAPSPAAAPTCQSPSPSSSAVRHDVFVSYSSKDQPVADALCAALEARGVRCWIASRDLPAGDDWAAAIIAAIADCRVMALLLSGHTHGSTHVKREVERAVHHRKVLIPILTERVAAPPSLEYFISTHQWFDASAGPLPPRFVALATMIAATLADPPCKGLPA